MDLSKTFGTDKDLEKNGAWIDFGEGLFCLIARSGNPRYNRKFKEVSAPYKRAIRLETLADEKAEELMIQVMASTILLDWRGLTDNGVEVPYTPENAKAMLTKYPDFKDQVKSASDSMEAFKRQEIAETEKNSETSSSGSESTESK